MGPKPKSAKKNTALLIILIIVTGLAAIFYPRIKNEYAKAQLSEGKTQVSSYITAQRAYYAEYKTFANDIKTIGYSAEGKLRGELFTSAAELPVGFSSFLKQEHLPFIAKEKFVVLWAMNSRIEKKIFFVVGNEESKISVLEEFVPSEP